MKKAFTTMGIMTAAIALLIPAIGFGQVVIGDWDGMTDEGWIDNGNGLSITNAANTNKYSFEASQGAPTTALRIDQAGYDQNLRLNLQDNGLIDTFMTNNQIRFEFSVPPGTNGGYSGVELIINADGYGFNNQTDFIVEGDPDNGNASGPQYYFWNGSPARTAIVTYNYNAVLNAIGTNTPGYVEILFVTNPGGGAPEHVQINDVTLLQGLPPLLPSGSSPRLITPDDTPTMEAYFDDGTETVNSNTVTMTVDGIDVSTNAIYSYSASNSTTTISYTPTIPLEGGAGGVTHTAQVVVASSPGGTLFTNEWSFDVLLLDGITYLDASDATILMATTNDGPVGAGVPLVTSTNNAVDGIWRARTGFGIPAGTNSLPVGVNTISTSTNSAGTVLESADFFVIDNTPRLKVSVSGLLNKGYNVYVYYWSDEGDAPWGIRAGFEDTPGTDSLPLIANGVLIATDDSTLQDGRRLYQAYLGVVIGTSIDVFVEDLPATGNDRTWFDGIGYEPTGGAVLPPNIVSYSLAGGTATLTWESELGAFYSILHKTNLTDSSWSAAKTNIVSAGTNTSDSVSVSGADTEFFQIKGD